MAETQTFAVILLEVFNENMEFGQSFVNTGKSKPLKGHLFGPSTTSWSSFTASAVSTGNYM